MICIVLNSVSTVGSTHGGKEDQLGEGDQLDEEDLGITLVRGI